MGLKNAPRTCQALIDMIMRGVQFRSCLIYVDDVIIYAREWGQHLRDVEDVLQDYPGRAETQTQPDQSCMPGKAILGSPAWRIWNKAKT